MTTPVTPRKNITVAISGASGAVYGVRLLHSLRNMADVQTHLVVSDAGWLNVQQELDLPRAEVEALADVVYPVRNIGSAIASGSFRCDGMVIAPCSMRTLAAVALGLSDNLITRAADVMLKERRKLILMVRETPLNLAHLRNMTRVTEMGGIIFPPVPGFYQRPQTIEEMVSHTVSRVMDLLGLPQADAARWNGL
ncbi:MAG: 3-octaprenyl-4-hydroxybenzoate carboxy-lyase [Burkholderiales bacterium RIFOXYD2_FULL_59_8]|nr:MAG: 3-octaprenyl-4-hydroxybenzoate carboxy-lyase [Burkholderiales bacterium RIFOXYD12_FULL_59_19]OGB81416.1 MAG: 3-octaprenyl-4-hydroxybenzoate carboxy-lyase [Burkholderiales bacterium RIFOXYC12_FULL_60_6]OGB84812.1 MAG: 3-octaprenyl-4-hydroxybenzoate carboxy-lyase [Burkholderiales bacterium RIFOXYD2_FULL_59_8]